MYASGLRIHLHLLRVIGFLLGLLLLIGWGLASLDHTSAKRDIGSETWQWAPASSFQDTSPPANGWIPFSSKPNLQNEANGVYWLRIPLASALTSDSISASVNPNSFREPQLWIFNAAALRVYDRGQWLFAYDPSERQERINLFTYWNLAPLPSPLPSEVYLLLNNHDALRPIPSIRLIDKADMMVELIRRDTYSFLLAGLFFLSACVTLGLYAGRRDKLYWHFFLLSLCGCYAAFVRNYILQLYWDQPWLSYMEIAVFPFGVYAFVSIIHEAFRDTLKNGMMDKLRRLLLSFSLVTMASALFLKIQWYSWLLSYPLLTVFLLTAACIFWVLRSAYRERKDPESIWMLAGFLIVTTIALIHVLRMYIPAVFGWIERLIPYVGSIPFDMLSIALFLFQICLVRVIIYRFGVLNDKLKVFNRELEEKVSKRTKELQERTLQLKDANTRLSRSMRETAETIANSMVLEERNRITGTIHDTIGHSFTATLVQLEAAKRLLDRDPAMAEDKLAASQELVRRGLDQIRQSVRLLRDDSSQYDLTEAMLQLIRETESSTGVVVDCRIDRLPDTLSTLQKKVLFQALQEGLTNGLRHGGSRRFQFSLFEDGGRLRFRLDSDGTTYTPSAFGFGLRAMSERVAQLGGMMTIAPGNPGCTLSVSLPCEVPAQSNLTIGGLE